MSWSCFRNALATLEKKGIEETLSPIPGLQWEMEIPHPKIAGRVFPAFFCLLVGPSSFPCPCPFPFPNFTSRNVAGSSSKVPKADFRKVNLGNLLYWNNSNLVPSGSNPWLWWGQHSIPCHPCVRGTTQLSWLLIPRPVNSYPYNYQIPTSCAFQRNLQDVSPI